MAAANRVPELFADAQSLYDDALESWLKAASATPRKRLGAPPNAQPML